MKIERIWETSVVAWQRHRNSNCYNSKDNEKHHKENNQQSDFDKILIEEMKDESGSGTMGIYA